MCFLLITLRLKKNKNKKTKQNKNKKAKQNKTKNKKPTQENCT